MSTLNINFLGGKRILKKQKILPEEKNDQNAKKQKGKT